MMFPVLAIAVIFLLAVFAFLFYRLASRFSPESGAAEWLDGFSLESYAPMARLLDQSDFQFLASHPGYYPALRKRLRAERRQVFVGYLGLMIRDFNQLLKIGRLMLVNSKEDRPEFARALWRQQMSFYFAVCSIRCKLALTPFGLRVEGLRLVDSLASMLRQVQELAVLRTEAY
jgi:hypothetical protein